MSCLPCEEAERMRSKELTAINKIKGIARAYATERNIDIIEIVKLKAQTGAYSWKLIGEQHQHEHVEYLLI